MVDKLAAKLEWLRQGLGQADEVDFHGVAETHFRALLDVVEAALKLDERCKTNYRDISPQRTALQAALAALSEIPNE